MAKTLFLFTGLTPNIKGHTYFNIKVFANYLNYLKANYDYKEISDDNYRINANIVKISTENLTNKLFTYAVETDGNGWHRCFFIETITEQSNMLYLGLSIDYWGSYYLASNVEHLHVIRCNRNIGVGIYDDIKHVANNSNLLINDYAQFFKGENITGLGNFYWPASLREGTESTYDIEKLSVVIILNYNAKQSLIGSNKISTTGIFAKTVYFNEGLAYNDINILKAEANRVAGIFGIINDIEDPEDIRDAEVVSAYLIPTELLKFAESENDIILRSKRVTTDGSIIYSIDTWHEVVETTKETEIEITNYDLNKIYIAGTYRNSGLKLKRFTTSRLYFNYAVETNTSGLHVYIKQGDAQVEITKDFALENIGGTIEETDIRKLRDVLSIENSIIRGGTRGFSAYGGGTGLYGNIAGIFGAGIGAGNAFLSNVQNFNVIKTAQGQGEALSTYDIEELITKGPIVNKQFVRTPYCVNLFTSINDEEKNARYYGANFNEIVENINNIFTFSLLGTGDYTLTVLIADDVKINNLPAIARREIETAFNIGVELLDYEGTANN